MSKKEKAKVEGGLMALNLGAFVEDVAEQQCYERVKRTLLENFVEEPERYWIHGVLFPVEVIYKGKKKELDWWAPVLCLMGDARALALTWREGEVVQVEDIKAVSNDSFQMLANDLSTISVYPGDRKEYKFRWSRGGEFQERFFYLRAYGINRENLIKLMRGFLKIDEEWYRKLFEENLKAAEEEE